MGRAMNRSVILVLDGRFENEDAEEENWRLFDGSLSCAFVFWALLGFGEA